MEIKETNFKKFIPSKDKALRWTVNRSLYGNVLEYSPCEEVIDVNCIVGEVEEVDYEEYEKWFYSRHCLDCVCN